MVPSKNSLRTNINVNGTGIQEVGRKVCANYPRRFSALGGDKQLFLCCPTKLGFCVVSSLEKCFRFGKTPNDVVVLTYIAVTVRRLSSITLNPAFSFSAVDSNCQLVFVPKRCVSR